jgi:hypothetical protein
MAHFIQMSKSRAFYKLPFCHERKKYIDHVKYDDIEALYDKMKEIDDYFMSDEFKDKILVKIKINMNINQLLKLLE